MLFRTSGAFLPSSPFLLLFRTPRREDRFVIHVVLMLSFPLQRAVSPSAACWMVVQPHRPHWAWKEEVQDSTRKFWVLQEIGARKLTVPSYAKNMAVWDQSPTWEKTEKSTAFTLQRAACTVLQSVLCFDKSLWKHWNKTIRRLWLLPVLLSVVAGVMKEEWSFGHLSALRVQYRLWYPLTWFKKKKEYGANLELFRCQWQRALTQICFVWFFREVP